MHQLPHALGMTELIILFVIALILFGPGAFRSR